MDKVRKKILQEWSGKGILSTNLKVSNLQNLFDLYDKIAFNGQISKKLKESTYRGFPSFVVVSKCYPKNKGLVKKINWCDTSCFERGDVKIYNIRVPQSILSRIQFSTSSLRKKTFGFEEEDVCLAIYFEHQIVHLLSLIWNYVGSVKNNSFENVKPEDKINGVHGELYRCAAESFFQANSANVYDKLADLSIIPKPPNSSKVGVYVYWSNSCNIDSLTMTLLMCKTSIFRNAMFSTNSSVVDYTKSSGKFMSPCVEKSKLTNEEYWRDFVSKVQGNLFEDYMYMINGTDPKKCQSLRKILAECYTDMLSEGKWVFYSIAEIYSLYAHMFPSIMFDKAPYYYVTHNKKIPRIEQSPKEMFTFWEYMDPLILDKNDKNAKGTSYIWNKMNYDILVFRNGGYPAITQFGSEESEEIKVPDFSSKTIVKHTIHKARAFGETICDGKYEMVGACVLQGTVPGKDGGVHYVSYIKTENGWIYYNDDGPVWKSLDGFPKNVLYESNGNKPELYFYCKKEKSPIVKPRELSTKVIQSQNLKVKIINRPFDYDVIFVQNENKKLIKPLMKLEPQTVVSDDIVMWRVNSFETDELIKNIFLLDVNVPDKGQLKTLEGTSGRLVKKIEKHLLSS